MKNLPADRRLLAEIMHPDITQTHEYRFYWAPEGRMVAKVETTSEAIAWSRFRRKMPQYARYSGEVYVTIDETAVRP